MTKEQEAIEILKEFKEKGYANLYIKYNGNRTKINLKIKKSIKNVLSMLSEKDKVIKKLNKGQQSLIQSRKKWKNRYYKIKRELRDKDKVIDLMSEQLTTPIHNKEWIKQYYENKAKGDKQCK